MTASQFDKLSDDEVDKLPSLPLVVARCAPSTKVRMIEALRRRGGYSGMTGDGVNDAPSLKLADVGIAMGQGESYSKEESSWRNDLAYQLLTLLASRFSITVFSSAGSDVAKDASDIVLADDNFASIGNGIEEGRRMFDNIVKLVTHLLAQNIAQACVLLIGLAFKDETSLSVFPLSPVEVSIE